MVNRIQFTTPKGTAFSVDQYLIPIEEDAVKTKRPFVLIFPSGGFNTVQMRESRPMALAFNAAGFSAAVINYPLNEPDHSYYPEGFIAGLKALSYFSEKAEELGLDPDRFVSAGFSAGGLSTLMMDAFASRPDFLKEFGFTDEKFILPTVQLIGYGSTELGLGWPTTQEAVEGLSEDERFRDASKYVDEKTPATFLFDTSNDPVVAVENTLKYAMALSKGKVPFEVHSYRPVNPMHPVSLATEAIVPYTEGAISDDHIATWFDLFLTFAERIWN